MKIIARYRCSNQESVNCFWKKKEEKKCEECGMEPSNSEHMLNGCGGKGKSNWNRQLELDVAGTGIREMKRLGS